MKKIAYIEIDTHAEIAQSFMDIMEDSESFAVDYYFSKKIGNQVNKKNETVFLSDSSMILDQLKAKEYDLVVIGTVHRFFTTFLTIVQKYNAALIVHNLNFSKASKWDLFKSVFKGDVAYRLKLWVKEGLFNSSKVYETSKSLLVLDEALSSEKYRFLPLFYTRNFDKTENDDKIVVIPGGVSQIRRDYNHIFETIQNLKTDKRYTFVCLGKAKDKELKKLEELSGKVPENIRIVYFSERVSSGDFEKWMQDADVLWCPIREETEFFSMKEVYGMTKMTGNTGDAVTYGKWAVFPAGYSAKLDFIVPEKEDILEQIEQLSAAYFDFQKYYSKKEILKKTEQILSRSISI